MPTQALMTLNGDFTGSAAAEFAQHLIAADETPAANVRQAVLAALGREVGDAELQGHLALLERLRREHQLSYEQALQTLCLGLFNLNEFLWID